MSILGPSFLKPQLIEPPLGFFFDLRSLNLALDFAVAAFFFLEAMSLLGCFVSSLGVNPLGRGFSRLRWAGPESSGRC